MKNRVICFLLSYVLLFFIPLISIKKGDVKSPVTLSEKEDESSSSVKSDNENSTGITDVNDVFLIKDKPSGKIYQVAAKDYLISAISIEMFPTFHPEALKAQAVACYTYAYKNRQSALNDNSDATEKKDYHFEADIDNFETYTTVDKLKEKWGSSFDINYDKMKQCVDAVYGDIMLYDKQPISSVYHSISSGNTERASTQWSKDEPYLNSVESPGDKLAPDYKTTVTISKDEVKKKLEDSYKEIKLEDDYTKWFETMQRSGAGCVEKVTIGGLDLKGSDIRSTLGLRSPNFTVEAKDDKLTFTVLGYGHGIGMSQYGADYYARQGMGYKDILSHYYSGIEIVNIVKKSD